MPRSRASATAHYLVTARAGGIAPETLARAALRAARVLLLLQLVLLLTLLTLHLLAPRLRHTRIPAGKKQEVSIKRALGPGRLGQQTVRALYERALKRQGLLGLRGTRGIALGTAGANLRHALRSASQICPTSWPPERRALLPHDPSSIQAGSCCHLTYSAVVGDGNEGSASRQGQHGLPQAQGLRGVRFRGPALRGGVPDAELGRNQGNPGKPGGRVALKSVVEAKHGCV